MLNKVNTAILFFSRSAAQEARKKTFNSHIGIKGNIQISQSLINNSLKTIKGSGLPIIECFGNDQVGSCFGERLANAVESVYLLGYSNVIVVGNDCPFVTTQSIESVVNSLDSNRLVLGPALDGGVYIFGMNMDSYERSNFINLPWETGELQSGFASYAHQYSITITWLEKYFDIDGIKDFKKLLSALPNHCGLYIQLRSILYKYKTLHFVRISTISNRFQINKLPLRGPPFIASQNI